jgi:FAD/FMN-containing dehydrogenase
MSRFNDIRYYPPTKTLDVGAGCTFDEIYKEIRPLHINIVGGSAIEGIGVGGWLLGGGYSLKTNQFGLGIDNISKFQIVVPDGGILDVAEGDLEHKDLFEAVKVCPVISSMFTVDETPLAQGGGNNFGIVTRFTLKTHPQGQVYVSLFLMKC